MANYEVVDCREWCHWCQGEYWKKRSQAEKDSREPWCEWCGIPRTIHQELYGEDLTSHHLTYIRQDYELSSDFAIICGRCHALYAHPEYKLQDARVRRPEYPYEAAALYKETYRANMLEITYRRLGNLGYLLNLVNAQKASQNT